MNQHEDQIYHEQSEPSNNLEPMSEVYRDLGRDTEAGRLLYTLYGKKPAPVVVRLKTKPAKRIDPHTEHQMRIRAKAQQIANDKRGYVAPLPERHIPERSGPVFMRPLRKPQNVIQAETRAAAAEIKDEIRGLRGRFQSRESLIQQLQDSNASRGKLKPIRQEPKLQTPRLTEEEHRFNEVNEQINERRQFLAEMKSLGQLDKTQERRLTCEIAERVSELNSLHESILRQKHQ
jgi:hypothetical protein